MRSMILAALSGLLLGLAFPPYGLGILSFVAYVPLLILWVTRAQDLSKAKIFALTYLCFFIDHGIANWWVSSWQDRADPYLFASGIALWIGHPVFLSVPFYLLASIRARAGATTMLWLTPAAIAGFEWLHGQSDASYPWLSTGYDLTTTVFGQAADLVGVYGLTIGIVIVNVLIVFVARHGQNAVDTRRYRRRVVLAAVTFLLVWGGYGAMQHRAYGEATDDPEEAVTAMAIQPNEDPWNKWAEPGAQVNGHRSIVDSARSRGRSADLVVWSETAIPFTIRQPAFNEQWQDLRTWVDTSGFALLTGYSDIMVYPAGQAPPSARTSTVDPTLRYDAFNAAMLVQRGQRDIPVHRKSMLTPFAERLPFADDLTFAMQWFEWGVGMSGWGKGQRRDPLPFRSTAGAQHSIGTIICIESIYPEVARDMVLNGADVLAVITNDAWFNGTPGPWQHEVIARMRAIETRRSIVRCANSGISAMIRPSGDDDVLTPMQRGALIGTLPTSTAITPFVRIGNVLPIACLILIILAALATRFPALLRNMRLSPTH